MSLPLFLLMLGLLLILFVGGLYAGLLLSSLPRWRPLSMLAVVPCFGALGAFILSFVLVYMDVHPLIFFCGYVFGGLLGGGAGLWLAFAIWRSRVRQMP